MNKKLYYAILSLTAVTVFGFLMNSGQNKDYYTPRSESQDVPVAGIEGAYEYLYSLKSDQATGEIRPEWIKAARAQAVGMQRLNKSSYPIKWEAAGPDNVGGRTRALLIDRNDRNILYAGGVSGGLWKSINKGASWYMVDDSAENMIIGSICQSVNGTIYYGTGERFASNSGNEFGSPGFPGEGIFKSTDGSTFTQLPTTVGYNYVSKMVSHPTDNVVFAATENGLKYSDDDGATWKNSKTGDCRDISIDRNGNMLIYLSGSVWRSSNPTDGNSFLRVDGLPGGSRMAITHSFSNPKYAYVVVTGNVTFTTPTTTISVGSGLVGIYQSKDNGVTFEQIVGKANTYFAPFTHIGLNSSQGGYDICIAVHPYNHERVFIGGIEWAEWTPNSGPKIVGNTFNHPANKFGIHADKHYIAFDTVSEPAIMYICSDGGVAKTTNASLTNYTEINNGYQTTQFYGISASRDGKIVGGTQDNGSIVIDGLGSSPTSGYDILGGDGFRAEFSQKNNDVLFAQSQYSRLARSINAGGSVGSMFDERVKTNFVTATETSERPSNIFNAPLALYEDENGPMNRLFYSLNSEVWMAENAVTSPAPVWFRIVRTGWDPHQLAVSPDGSSLYVASIANSRIVRVDGLLTAQFDSSVLGATDIDDSLSVTDISDGLPGGRSITDIEIDPNNPDRVIVTLGNYNSSSYVYITENATSDNVTWRSIQGVLPQAPVYDAMINPENSSEILVGTEFGVYGTKNGTAMTPAWSIASYDLPLVPVFELRGVEAAKRQTWRTGPMVYAGTYGNGIWKTRNFLTSVNDVKRTEDVSISLYPNPAAVNVTASFRAEKSDVVEVTLADLMGKVVHTQTIKVVPGERSVTISVADLKEGTYFMSFKGQHHAGAVKFIKS